MAEVAKNALSIPKINVKTVMRNFEEFCTGVIERATAQLGVEDTTKILAN